MVFGYSSRPRKTPFLRSSCKSPYLLSSALIKKHIAKNSSFFVAFFSRVASSILEPKIKGDKKMCSPPIISKLFCFALKRTKYSSSDSFCPCLTLKKPIICSCSTKIGFAFASTPAVSFFSFTNSHNTSKISDLASYSGSPFNVDLNACVHCPKTTAYNLCMLPRSFHSRLKYCLIRSSHILILTGLANSSCVRSFGAWFFSNAVVGS